MAHFSDFFLYFFNLFHLIEFSWIIQIITASHSNNEKNEWKMIFMLFSIMWGHIQEQTTNFEHLVHETWPRTCSRVIFKFYKQQTKTENLETYRDVMISYVEAVIKNWGDFAQVVMYDACKPKSASLRQRRGRAGTSAAVQEGGRRAGASERVAGHGADLRREPRDLLLLRRPTVRRRPPLLGLLIEPHIITSLLAISIALL